MNTRETVIRNLKGTIAGGGNEDMMKQIKRKLKSLEDNKTVNK